MAFQASKTFINLPVKDLKKTMDFFSQVGFEFNLQFTDDNAACMVINEHTFAMLLVESFFQTFTKKELVDATRSTEVLVAMSADSRSQVDEIVNSRRKPSERSAGSRVYVRLELAGRERPHLGSLLYG